MQKENPMAKLTSSLPAFIVPCRLVACLALAGALASPAAWAQEGPEACFSGVEVHPGNSSEGVTSGATFAGWDSPAEAESSCTWSNGAEGGRWLATLDHNGPAGLGHTVAVLGGKWQWDDEEVLRRGKITGGWVVWPENLEEDIDCGAGIARFCVNLSLRGRKEAGKFEGCLDDSHLNPLQQPFVFPARMLGKLSLDGSRCAAQPGQ